MLLFLQTIAMSSNQNLGINVVPVELGNGDLKYAFSNLTDKAEGRARLRYLLTKDRELQERNGDVQNLRYYNLACDVLNDYDLGNFDEALSHCKLGIGC